MQKITESNQKNLLSTIISENFLDNVGNPKNKELLKSFREDKDGKLILEFTNGQKFEFMVKEIIN